MKRIRPIFLLVTLALGAAGYFMCTSVWADLMRIKGPSWFGTEVQARIVDAGEFLQISWTPGVEGSGGSRDHTRVKYEFEVDGRTYHYPYEEGFVEVAPEQAALPTIPVTYWNGDPARNHPVGKDYRYGDEMAGLILGLLVSIVALLMAVVWVRGLVRPPPPSTSEGEAVAGA